jgi:hypothetical protein
VAQIAGLVLAAAGIVRAVEEVGTEVKLLEKSRASKDHLQSTLCGPNPGTHCFQRAVCLINTNTLELSFIEPEEARELMERPVPEFNMRYESGVVDRIPELTHRHPYLLQAIGSELVIQLNMRNRTAAAMGDLNAAVEKTLVSAQAYFHYVWTDECSDEEREALAELALGEDIGQD